MVNISIPFTEQKLDTSEPTSFVTGFALLVVGFVAFAMAQMLGDQAAQSVMQMVGEIIGFNPATGNSDDPPGV